MRQLSAAAALAVVIGVSPASAGIVTVSGPSGQIGSYTQIADAMAWISASGDPTTDYAVWAGSGQYSAFEAVENSNLSWGNSPGVIEIDGTMRVRSNSRLNVEIGGTSNANALTTGAVDYDTILCTGLVKFEGTLKVSLINGFTPVFGHSFEVIASGTDVQLFNTAVIDAPALAGGLSWQLSVGPSSFVGTDYAAKSLFLTVVPGPGALAMLALAGLRPASRRRG